MAQSDANLTVLQFLILNGMADDYEDIEQLYLFANRDLAEEEHAKIGHPHKIVCERYPLREIIDEIGLMVREKYIEA